MEFLDGRTHTSAHSEHIRVHSHMHSHLHRPTYTVPADTATGVHLPAVSTNCRFLRFLFMAGLCSVSSPPAHRGHFPGHSPTSTPRLPLFLPYPAIRVPGRKGISPGSLPRTTAFLHLLRKGERGDAGGAWNDVERAAPGQPQGRRQSGWAPESSHGKSREHIIAAPPGGRWPPTGSRRQPE